MKIAVNGKSLAIREKGGAVKVALNILRHTALRAPDIVLDVYIPIPIDWKSASIFPSNVRWLVRPPLVRKGRAVKAIWEQFTLPNLVQGHNYDLLLNLTNSAPVLLSVRIPQLLLVHDAGFYNRKWFSASYSWYVTLLLRMAVVRRIQLVTVSATSAQQLTDIFPKLAGMPVILNGVDHPPGQISAAELNYPYVLFLGSLNPRKNLQGAVKGFRLYKQQYGGNVRFLIVGAEKRIFADADGGVAVNADIEIKSYIDDQYKWSLLKDASALLLPSFLEGFGLPIAEALKVGTPAIASDIPVFHELFGDHVQYVDPDSPTDIARGLTTVLRDPPSSNQRNIWAKTITEQFSWGNAADRYIQLFKKVGEHGNRNG